MVQERTFWDPIDQCPRWSSTLQPGCQAHMTTHPHAPVRTNSEPISITANNTFGRFPVDLLLPWSVCCFPIRGLSSWWWVMKKVSQLKNNNRTSWQQSTGAKKNNSRKRADIGPTQTPWKLIIDLLESSLGLFHVLLAFPSSGGEFEDFPEAPQNPPNRTFFDWDNIQVPSNLPLRLRLTFRSVIAQPIFHFTQSQAQNTAYSRDEEGGEEGGGTKGNVIPSPVGAWGP